MTATPLDRAALLILDGILVQLPKLSPDRLDQLLARVSWIHRQRVAKSRADENAQKTHALVVRMQSAAAHTDPSNGASADPPPVTESGTAVKDTSRMGNRHRSRKNDAGDYVCIICDAPLEWSGRGRVPVFCRTHKNPATRATSAHDTTTREGAPQ
jgi:hypothetical protein